MYLIYEGGPFALGVVAWALMMVPLLAVETRKSPAWFPGLHAGLFAVLFGLGTTGWLMGLENVVQALQNADEANQLKFAVMGNIVAPNPFILAGLVGGLAAPWMIWNTTRTRQARLIPAPLIRGFTWATGLCIALSAFLAVPIITMILRGGLLGAEFPVQQLVMARWIAIAAIPMGLLNIVLAFAAARRQQAATKNPTADIQVDTEEKRRPAPQAVSA